MTPEQQTIIRDLCDVLRQLKKRVADLSPAKRALFGELFLTFDDMVRVAEHALTPAGSKHAEFYPADKVSPGGIEGLIKDLTFERDSVRAWLERTA